MAFQSLGPGVTSVYMRGVASGENSNHSGPLPSVGVYLDEQPITTITGALDIHVYDIARVEALAGPQGTLYGASSQAGTIRIITNKPDPTEFKASYDLTLNTVKSGDPGYVGEGFVNVPLTDKAAIRLVGWYRHDGGYIDNVLGSRTFPTLEAATGNGTVFNTDRVDKNYNDVDTYGARAALKIDLDDSWTIMPTIMGQRQDSNGIFGYDPRVGDLKVAHFKPEYQNDKWGQAALTVQGRVSNFDLVYAGAYLKRDVDSSADYSDYAYFYDVNYGYGALHRQRCRRRHRSHPVFRRKGSLHQEQPRDPPVVRPDPSGCASSWACSRSVRNTRSSSATRSTTSARPSRSPTGPTRSG